MPAGPFPHVAAQQRLAAARNLIRLLAGVPVDTPVGQLREVLAPVDTAAFPPAVLGMPVIRTEAFPRPSVLGAYHHLKQEIMLRSAEKGIEPLGYWAPYNTLLHEAGHARGSTQSKHLIGEHLIGTDFEKRPRFHAMDVDSLILLRQLLLGMGENRADAVAESLSGIKRTPVAPDRKFYWPNEKK